MSSVHFSVSVTRYFSTASLIKRRSVQSKALGCVVVACCVYSPVQAAPDAGALLNQQERSQVAPAAPSTLHAPQITTPNIPFAGDGTNNTQTILLQKIQFDGDGALLSAVEQQGLVAGLIGQPVTLQQLEQASAAIAQAMQQKGYVARAYLPPQDVTKGILHIQLVVSRLATDTGGRPAVTVSHLPGSSQRTDAAWLSRYASQSLSAGQVLRLVQLEHAVLLLDDLPGLQVQAQLEAGAQPNTTALTIGVKEGSLWSGSAWADNYGSRSTGITEAGVLLNLNSPARHGDQASLTLSGSEGLKTAKAAYSMPVGYAGWRLQGMLTAMDYELVSGTGKTAGLEGQSRLASLGLNVPLFRSRLHSVQSSFFVTHKALTDDAIAGKLRDKRVNSGAISLDGSYFDSLGAGGSTQWSVAQTVGKLDLDKVAADAAADAVTYRTAGRYSKTSISVSRHQALTPLLNISLDVSGQYATQNLDSSEQFMLGGSSGVRAYPGSEASGDVGWLASLELTYALQAKGQWGLSGFYDVGHIRLHDDAHGIPIPTATGQNGYGLSGAGLALSWSDNRRFNLKTAWAHTLGDNPGRTTTGQNADGEHDKQRLWLQAALWF